MTQEILKKIATINSLSDYFFMKSTKVKPSTELLIKEIHQNMSEIKNEEAKKCLDIMSKKLGSGKLMSSLELNSMEVKFELFKSLYYRYLM